MVNSRHGSITWFSPRSLAECTDISVQSTVWPSTHLAMSKFFSCFSFLPSLPFSPPSSLLSPLLLSHSPPSSLLSPLLLSHSPPSSLLSPLLLSHSLLSSLPPLFSTFLTVSPHPSVSSLRKPLARLNVLILFHFCYRYSSGAEDGYVRVHRFDSSYQSFDFDY